MTPDELRLFRVTRRWTLAKLGEMVGYAESTLSKYENGQLPIPARLSNVIYLMNTVETLKKEGEAV